MGKWTFISREYWNHEYDLITYQISYGKRTIENQYLILKDEKRIPNISSRSASIPLVRLTERNGLKAS